MAKTLERQYRISEAAEMLGLKECTLRKWVLFGRLRITKLGAAVRIPETELRRIICSGERPARGAAR